MRDAITSLQFAILIADKQQAESRVAELEALIAEHEFLCAMPEHDGFLCPVCYCEQGNDHLADTPGCAWGQAAANHRSRVAQEAPCAST